MRPTISTPSDRAALESHIDDRIAHVDGRVGVVVGYPRGPADGEFETVVAREADTAFASASVIKLPVLYALFRKHDPELDALDRPHGLADENRVGGAGLFHLLDSVEPSLRDLARGMIAISDNAATNEIVDHVGIDAVNDVAAELGMTRTHLDRKLMMDDGADGDPVDDDDGPRNTTSPRDCARFYAELLHGDDLSAAAREEQLDVLGSQKDPTMFPRYAPPGTPLAHKTGYIHSAALDTGLVEPDGDELFFAVFCDRASHGGDATDVIAEIGDAVLAWHAD